MSTSPAYWMFSCLMLCLLPSLASAHPEGVTLTSLWVSQQGVRVERVIPDRFFSASDVRADLDADRVAARVAKGWLVTADDQTCQRRGDPEVWRLPDIDSRRFLLEFDCPASADRLTVEDELAKAADANHENFVRYHIAGSTISEVLTPERNQLIIPLRAILSSTGMPLAPRFPAETTLAPNAWSFVRLGFEHILAGIDHLLFLAGLFLVVMPWRQLLGIITAFTLGHSITLGLSALGIYSATPWIAESVIALSIVYLAVENLFTLRRARRTEGNTGAEVVSTLARRRWLIAGGFGLIHGFGFSYVLRDLGLPENNAISALAGFNIGVELGQFFALAILLPTLTLLWRKAPALPVSALGSVVIGLIGSWWVIERTLL